MKTKETGAKAALRSKGYLPAGEVADRLGFNRQTIYEWENDKKVHGVRLGAGRWVQWSSVVAYLKEKDPETAKLLGLV